MKRNGNAERRGVGSVEGYPFPYWGGAGEWAVPPPQNFLLLIFCLPVVHFGAFWALVLMLV